MAFRTPAGTWRVHARFNGRRISKTFRTKILAQKFEAELKLAEESTPVEEKLREEIPEVKFADFADRWLKQHSEVEKAESSQREDRSMVKVYLKPLLGEKLLSELRRSDYLEVKAALKMRMATRGLKPKSANNILNGLKTIVRTAVRWGLLERYPWDELTAFPVLEQPFDYWSPKEMAAFYSGARFASPELADMALFAFHTGLRLGEITGLKWSSVDLAAKRISVRETYNAELRKQLDRTKNGTIGSVPLNEAAAAVLERRKAKASASAAVFTERGLKVTQNFMALAKRLGVRPIRFHDLRHSFASNLMMSGVDIYTVQRLMRHKSLSQTQRYAHLAPGHLADAVAKISGTDLAPISGSQT